MFNNKSIVSYSQEVELWKYFFHFFINIQGKGELIVCNVGENTIINKMLKKKESVDFKNPLRDKLKELT